MSLRDVLAVLDDDQRRLWVTFDRAVRLADAEGARFTLAKTTDPGRVMRWVAPAAVQSMGIVLVGAARRPAGRVRADRHQAEAGG